MGSTSSPEGLATASTPKPKQSKSRNGCGTCKAKRLKCDESKPTCRQCHKRGVACAGYKKDFKWRPFEEGSFGAKAQKGPRKVGAGKPKKPPPPLVSPEPSDEAPTPSTLAGESPRDLSNAQYTPPPQNFNYTQEPYLDPIFLLPAEPTDRLQQFSPVVLTTMAPGEQGTTIRQLEYGRQAYGPDSDSSLAPVNINNTPTLNPMQEELVAIPPPVGYADPSFSNPPIPTIVKYEPLDDEEGIEEVIRQPECDWMRSPSPANSSSSEASNYSGRVSATDIFRRPAVGATSQELLVLHFDKNTCGIMSVKDGQYENPWRTYVWPLGGESPALYHAIVSMTAFHMCIHRPELRFSGMEHMRLSLGYLARGFRDGDIQTDAALATTLVLAFAEAFDTHITTGIQHLRGAKALVSQALTMRRSSPPGSVAVKRFRFLYNVWVYLDVLARLTSDDDDGGHAFGIPLTHGPLSPTSEVDPLLGCSATLFPLIGRVAALAQRVRKTTRNSEALIAEAAEVKAHIEAWMPEASYESPDDPTSSVDNCVNAAEAYRWVTLLYLHQAVPELPSLPAQHLAAVVIRMLATVPISSRSSIIHIYPLLVAGCEAVTPQDRAWVKARWQAMSDRLWIGNVKKAWEVVAEVWDRRDRFIALNPGRGFGELATIRGRLHWFGVMREWNWEVLLG